MIKFSFVIPCYGSEDTIEKVIAEIEEVMSRREGFDYEIITVNDESPDNVLGVLKKMAAENKRLTVIDLSRNMGKHSAVMAGYSKVTGDFAVILDDDGQSPVDCLWQLYDALDENYDIAVAKYPEKKQSLFKNFGSHVNALMSTWLLEKPKGLQMSEFAILRRYVINEIIRYKNAYPNLEGLTLRTTRKIINVEMEHRERFAGEGHFTLARSLKLWLNGFTAFSVKPLRIAMIMGVITAAMGFIFGIAVVIRKLMMPEIAVGWSSTICIILFIGGMIMTMLGLIGEYVGRIYICINNSPQYVIREIINEHHEEQG